MIRTALTAGAVVAVGATAASAETFGAFAFSPDTGAWGSSYNHQSRASAEGRALSECRQRAGDCRSILWFRDACGAIATSPNGGWGSGWGGSIILAEREAINSCVSYGNEGCSVLTTQCSSQ